MGGPLAGGVGRECVGGVLSVGDEVRTGGVGRVRGATGRGRFELACGLGEFD